MKKYLLTCPFDREPCQHTEKYPKDLDCCECKRYHFGIQESGALIHWPTKLQGISLLIYIIAGIVTICCLAYLFGYLLLQFYNWLIPLIKAIS